MANPFLGEIRMFGGNFAPSGWALCNGQLLAIADYTALFTLIGTNYGGDGVNTFGLPDLQGRIPIHQGNSFPIGQRSGTETVTLTTLQIPSHTHVPQAQSSVGTQASPAGGFWASSNLNQFSGAAPNGSMNGSLVGSAGGNQSHNNLMPFLVVNFIIALQGVFPSQN